MYDFGYTFINKIISNLHKTEYKVKKKKKKIKITYSIISMYVAY